MFGAPTLLGLVSLAHPVVSPPIYPAILGHLPWWVRLHALNLALFPLFALAAWLLLQEVRKEARGLPEGQLITAGALIDAYWTSPTIQALAVFGSIAWVVGMLAAAVAFTAPVLAGALFGASHVPPPARWARLAFSSRPA